MFPGQGAQAVGMCGTICDEVPKAKELLWRNHHLTSAP